MRLSLLASLAGFTFGLALSLASPLQAKQFVFTDVQAAPGDVFFQQVIGKIDLDVFPFLYNNEDRPAAPGQIGQFSKPGLSLLQFDVNNRQVDTMSFLEPDELILDLDLDGTGQFLIGSIFINEIDTTIQMISDLTGRWLVQVSGDNLCGGQTDPGCQFSGLWQAEDVAEPAGLALLALSLAGLFGMRRRVGAAAPESSLAR